MKFIYKIYLNVLQVIAVIISQFIFIGLLAYQAAKIKTQTELRRIETELKHKEIQKSETKSKN